MYIRISSNLNKGTQTSLLKPFNLLPLKASLFMRLFVFAFNILRVDRATVLLNRYQRTSLTRDLRVSARRAFVVHLYNLEISGRLFKHFIFNFVEPVNTTQFFKLLNKNLFKFLNSFLLLLNMVKFSNPLFSLFLSG